MALATVKYYCGTNFLLLVHIEMSEPSLWIALQELQACASNVSKVCTVHHCDCPAGFEGMTHSRYQHSLFTSPQSLVGNGDTHAAGYREDSLVQRFHAFLKAQERNMLIALLKWFLNGFPCLFRAGRK